VDIRTGRVPCAVGPSICFKAVLAGASDELVRAGAEVLINQVELRRQRLPSSIRAVAKDG
jgi:hypothetical protein